MEPGGHTTAEDSPRSLYETTGQSKLCLRCILVCQINCTNLAYIYIYIYMYVLYVTCMFLSRLRTVSSRVPKFRVRTSECVFEVRMHHSGETKAVPM